MHESVDDMIFAMNGSANGVSRQSSKDVQPKSLEDLIEFVIYDRKNHEFLNF